MTLPFFEGPPAGALPKKILRVGNKLLRRQNKLAYAENCNFCNCSVQEEQQCTNGVTIPPGGESFTCLTGTSPWEHVMNVDISGVTEWLDTRDMTTYTGSLANAAVGAPISAATATWEQPFTNCGMNHPLYYPPTVNSRMFIGASITRGNVPFNADKTFTANTLAFVDGIITSTNVDVSIATPNQVVFYVSVRLYENSSLVSETPEIIYRKIFENDIASNGLPDCMSFFPLTITAADILTYRYARGLFNHTVPFVVPNMKQATYVFTSLNNPP